MDLDPELFGEVGSGSAKIAPDPDLTPEGSKTGSDVDIKIRQSFLKICT
jgi:hypothetical protein